MVKKTTTLFGTLLCRHSANHNTKFPEKTFYGPRFMETVSFLDLDAVLGQQF